MVLTREQEKAKLQEEGKIKIENGVWKKVA